MPFVPTPCTQVTLQYLWNGQVCQQVLHYADDNGSIEILDVPSVGGLLVTAWNTSYKPDCPTTLSLTQINFVDLQSESGYSLTYGVGLPLVGTSPSPSLPNNVALVVTKRTAKRGRAYRGRTYIVGLTEGAVTDNTVSTGRVTNALNFMNSIRTLTAGGNTYTMVVPHRYVGSTPMVIGSVENVISFTSDGVVDSQRRRLPGRGA